MDRGKRPCFSVANKNSERFMQLEEIIREKALQYLPAKSVRRCTGVCKDWKLHISTLIFAHRQSNSFQELSGFFCRSFASLPTFVSLDPQAYGVPDPSLMFLPEKVAILSSSYGLLCCQGQTGYRPYYVCNPVTQQWKKIPRPAAKHGSNPAIVLVFKPSLLNFVADFKLVCAYKSVYLGGYEFEIYSSKDNSWRTSREVFMANHKIIPGTGVHVDGIVYWLSKSCGIVGFDLRTDRSRVFDAYLLDYRALAGVYLGEFRGKLCCGQIRGSTLIIEELDNPYYNTMEMDRESEGWNAREIILGNFEFEKPLAGRWLMFLGGNFAIVQCGREMVSCDLNSKDVNLLSNEAEENPVVTVPYVNTLVEM
ncbi:F-box protein At5g49610-like [Euphorbia lathyris]|uniref:F-box protein At5g49610-like n=1 Tax=Euphorbia lathyris TaxID=212925 RepID=UPI0033138DFF